MIRELCIYKQRKNIQKPYVKSVLRVVKNVMAISFINDKNDPKYSFLYQLLLFVQSDHPEILK